jgi:hypothetical protein
MNEIFAPLYELLYYTSPFSDDLYQEQLYAPLGIIALLSALLIAVLFYYVINRPSFSRWYHWLIMLGICFGINYATGVSIPKSKLSPLNPAYSSEYWTFAIFNSILAILLYIIFSFMIRWWSTNCKRTPIPN